MVTLEAVGQARIDVDMFNEYVRINNNNRQVSAAVELADSNDGTYTLTFDLGKAG